MLFRSSKLSEALGKNGKKLSGAKILLLGIAYKKDIDDPRESPSFKIIELLIAKGAKVEYNDPFIPKMPKMRHYPSLAAVPSIQKLTKPTLSNVDAVVIATDHSNYDYEWIVKNAKLVVDTRNATRNVKVGTNKIVKA